MIEHRLIYPASSLYFFEALAVWALTPPAVFAGVSVPNFLGLLVAAGARVLWGGGPPFIYCKGR
jgi:hypothetical protein